MITKPCRHCPESFVVPDLIHDTSESLRFILDLCPTCWTKAKADYDEAMDHADEEMRPLTEAIENSTRLTAEDFNIIVRSDSVPSVTSCKNPNALVGA